ncbi:MAG: SDR family NAD(P)-dependent oxidoreductase [Phocaeicola sp.]|nr:SDR family NAD(P)-dependent oxidoreductase [Phocaeicola sp.]
MGTVHNNNSTGKRAIIVGATSGIGYEVAKILYSEGWIIGIAGRREENLIHIRKELGEKNIFIKTIDIRKDEAEELLYELIRETGGMDLYFHSSGIGHQNYSLQKEIEINTVATNGVGFTRMVGAAYRYFKEHNNGNGHIAVISSIAGTKGLGAAPAYSATKRFQNIYIDALEQLCHINNEKVSFTDIRPGFVGTGLLNDGKNYPMLMKADYVAKHIVSALNKKKRTVIIDWRYRVLVFFWKRIPGFIWKRMKVRN